MQSHSKAHAISHQIEQLIVDGKLLPEQKIPSERQLCTKLCVSRSAIREALRELQGRGLITTKQGQGSFVTKIIPAKRLDPFMHLCVDHQRTLYDVYEVREQLEGQAAFLAAQRATQKDIYRITKAYNALQKEHKRGKAKSDQVFHKSIFEASHNPVLLHLLASLEELLLHSVEVSITHLYPIEDLKLQMDKHHRYIYQAVINQQPQRAKNAAIRHVKFVSDNLKALELRGQRIFRDALTNSAELNTNI